MADRQRSIQNMQTVLSMRLTAVHQYLLHAHVLGDWGLDRLSARMRDEMQEELGHAEKLTDRILFLGGTPDVSEAKAPEKASGLLELFSSDLKEEQSSIASYTKAADAAHDDSDVGTRVLFKKLILDEEEHAEWLNLQTNLVERLGEPVYSMKQLSKTS